MSVQARDRSPTVHTVVLTALNAPPPPFSFQNAGSMEHADEPYLTASPPVSERGSPHANAYLSVTHGTGGKEGGGGGAPSSGGGIVLGPLLKGRKLGLISTPTPTMAGTGLGAVPSGSAGRPQHHVELGYAATTPVRGLLRCMFIITRVFNTLC